MHFLQNISNGILKEKYFVEPWVSQCSSHFREMAAKLYNNLNTMKSRYMSPVARKPEIIKG